ncbi:hypothetical protein MHYP_G00266330 [Metynnis hypsauchen]
MSSTDRTTSPTVGSIRAACLFVPMYNPPLEVVDLRVEPQRGNKDETPPPFNHLTPACAVLLFSLIVLIVFSSLLCEPQLLLNSSVFINHHIPTFII